MAGIDNNRLFIVDNSLAQDTALGDGALPGDDPAEEEVVLATPSRTNPRSSISPPRPAPGTSTRRSSTPRTTSATASSATTTTASASRARSCSALDDHTEDAIKRLIDFLLEIELDLAEFTVLTPFPHTRAFADLKRENRILSYDWNDYSADKVVFQPRHMTPEQAAGAAPVRLGHLLRGRESADQDVQALSAGGAKEMEDNTFRPRDRARAKDVFGRPLGSG